jgi:hypothetical protein
MLETMITGKGKMRVEIETVSQGAVLCMCDSCWYGQHQCVSHEQQQCVTQP